MTNEIMAVPAGNDYNAVNGFFNTLDLSTLEGKRASVNAYNSAESLNKHVGEVLQIVHAFTAPGVRAARGNGEDVPCQNTYLIDAEGNAYFSQSDGVARSINMIASVFGEFKLSDECPYLPIACKESVLPNGNTLKTLEVIF